MAIFTGDPRDLALSQLNAANNPAIPFTKENLFFGKPAINPDGTSTVPCVGVLSSEYSLYSSFKFRRINLSKAFDSAPVVKAVVAETIHEMLPAISRELGLTFTANDIVDGAMTIMNPGEEANIVLKALPKSLGYTGSFIIRYLRTRQMLSNAVKNTVLDELKHLPEIPEDKRSLEMAMYSMDFTANKADLRTWGSYWYDYNRVKLVAEANGFPNWPSPIVNGVADYATKDYPLANPAFDRVIVQKEVSIDGFSGDGFFHYNLT
jgi:hypothetical protein